MKDAKVVPATTEEYRKMLDLIGLHTRVVEDGIDAIWWLGMRSFRLAFRRELNGWWSFYTVTPLGELDTDMWMSAYASADTREFITNYIASKDPRKR
ncbi:hypothetical protein [Streptomyces sp. NPDC017448]|uniref:hypothetical protein n=1 Tax=Streptomyces sp. NPDC017448 TaxID=3364996 RepID=UPI00379A0150